jgi:SAM-dependent methyltransferase
MSTRERIGWDRRHAGKEVGAPEPFFVAMLPLLRPGLVLDAAAGRGRHALAMARAGFRVVAADFSRVGLATARAAAAGVGISTIWPVVADFDNFPFRAGSFDSIVNINFLGRSVFPELIRSLKVGGVLLADTFLVDQAEIGHIRNPQYLLGHYELRELLAEMELMRYCERLEVYPDGSRAWRAGAVARRRA